MHSANIQAWTQKGRNVVHYIFLILLLIMYLMVNKASIKTLVKSKLVEILLLKKLWWMNTFDQWLKNQQVFDFV